MIKMKIINKIILSLIIIFLLISLCNVVLADDVTKKVKVINTDDFIPSDPTVDDAKPIIDKVGVILGAVRNISVVVSVIFLMIMGVKYMLASVEEKANYKASVMPYIIGCLLATSGITIVSFIYSAVH